MVMLRVDASDVAATVSASYDSKVTIDLGGDAGDATARHPQHLSLVKDMYFRHLVFTCSGHHPQHHQCFRKENEFKQRP